MSPIPGGRPARSLFAALLLGNLALLTWQVRIGESRFPGGDRLAAVVAVSRGGLAVALRSLGERFDAAFDPAGLRAERNRARDRLARLEWELTVQRGLLDRARGFTVLDREMFDVGEPLEAEVVGFGADPFDRSLTVNRGSEHGVFGGAPVMAAQGLVGRVIRVARASSQVALLTDPSSSAAALTAQSRTPGVVRPALGDSEEPMAVLALDFVSVGHRIAVGEKVISSGVDRLFPKGLPIGEVSAVRSGSGMLAGVWIVPLADFKTLERVFILPPVPDAGPWASR